MGNKLKKYISDTTIATQKELEMFLSNWKYYTDNNTPQLTKLTALFTDHLTGGKMLRSSLVHLGYNLNASDKNSDIYKIAAAFEIVHTSLLIHDDIIDKSDLRRNKPTIYNHLGKNHYAISQAICLGDMGFFLAIQLLTQCNVSSQIKSKLVQLFSQMLLDTILGEMIDVELTLPTMQATEAEIITMQKMKTAYYTIVWPLTIGAIVGKAKRKQLSLIKHFGEAVGIAYQIQDDILGIFGDEQQLGKSVISDIAEGKHTLLITYALLHANSVQKDLLTTHYGNPHVDTHAQEVIKSVFRDTGALHSSQMKLLKYIEKGNKIIPKITHDPILQQYLFEFTDYLTTRKK